MSGGSARRSRWLLVAAAVLVVGLAGTYQFAWSVLRGPLETQSGASETALGTVFTILVVSQTFTSFPAGWVRDRHGPRLPLLLGAALLAAGYAGAALEPSLPFLYLWFALGGAGMGVAYDIAINTPPRWFDRRRGMTTGMVSMSFSGTSFLLIPLIRRGVDADFVTTLLVLAAASGTASLVAAVVIRDTSTDESPAGAESADESSDPAATWRTMIRDRRFWLLYLVFAVVNGVGLMVIEKIATYASQLGLSTTAATAAAALVALGQAAGVLIVSSASDRLGAERTTAVTLVCCGVALVGMVAVGLAGLEWAFVALAGVVMFFRSPSFGIMPGLVSDYYGTAYASENYAVLLSAKLWGGVFGGTGTSLLVREIGWSTTFLVGAVLAVFVGLGALFAFRSAAFGPERGRAG